MEDSADSAASPAPSSGASVASGPVPAWVSVFAPAALGAALALLTAIPFQRQLGDLGFPAAQAWFSAAVLGAMLQMLWLPLLAIGWAGRARSGAGETLLAAGG